MSQFTASGDLTAIASALAGQYDIDREIGRGGMGVVYLARDLRLDRMVAIKTLPSQLADDSAVRERFLREARTAGRLSHPNIVPIYRADEIAGQVFFVMGFVDGDSLAGRLLASGPLSPRDTVPILRDVAAALGYAHKNGVVHRDVKTENILLDSATGRAMVTDFGIARLAEAAPLTSTGQLLGTVYYLSPEQVSGDEVDARSDIYALGVVGYAALSGQFPFDGPLASAVLVAHVTRQARPLASVAPNVPASLASIIDRCLSKDRSHRFQSCAELEAALTAAEPEAQKALATRAKSPLISDAEAQVVFKRAAELQDMTGVQQRPVIGVKPRDAAADARRSEGFKTSNLRDAAAEAGIDPKYVEHALVEQGLRPVPVAVPSGPRKADRRPTGVIYDLTRKRSTFRPEPTELPYEMVLHGEMPEEDFDLLVEVIRRHAEPEGLTGRAASVGREFTWSGRSRRGRELQVTVSPRHGKTTIRVAESQEQIRKQLYGALVGLGGAGGFALFAGLMSSHAPVGGALLIWGLVGGLATLVARVAGDEFSQKRQKALKALLDEIGGQVRESITASSK